jgi:hypothetical protein
MSKMILPMLVAALVCVAGSAKADGISASTLDEMGLSGLTVVSDSDALSIRGMGWTDSMNVWKAKKRKDTKQIWSAAAGNSIATVTDKHGNGSATSQNSYGAEGPYAASGENFSEATLSNTDVEIVDINGVVKSVTNVWSIHVEAGGFSSSMSF